MRGMGNACGPSPQRLGDRVGMGGEVRRELGSELTYIAQELLVRDRDKSRSRPSHPKPKYESSSVSVFAAFCDILGKISGNT